MRRIAFTILIAGGATSAQADLADIIVREARESVGIPYAYGPATGMGT